MGKLIYSGTASLDGYIADADGDFGFTEPDAEVHTFVNDLLRPVGTHLYGRRLYEVMLFWEAPDAVADEPAYVQDFMPIWQAAEKVVYSRTLAAVSSARTRIERSFDPDAVRQLAAAADRDVLVGGADLAGQALRAGLVDECHLFVAPVIIGAGTRFFPAGARLGLDLLAERRFGNGTVYLRYGVRA